MEKVIQQSLEFMGIKNTLIQSIPQDFFQFIESLMDKVTVAPANVGSAVHFEQAGVEARVEFATGRAFLEFDGEAVEHVDQRIVKGHVNIAKVVGKGMAALYIGQHQAESPGQVFGGFFVFADDLLGILKTGHVGNLASRIVDGPDNLLAAVSQVG
jgi:hypothetical protein